MLLEAQTLGFGASGRNGGFLSSSLTHGIENGRARFPDELASLERLGLDNFDGLQADLTLRGALIRFGPQIGTLRAIDTEFGARQGPKVSRCSSLPVALMIQRLDGWEKARTAV